MGKDKTDEEEALGMLKQLLLKLLKNDKDVQDSVISVTLKEQNNAQLIKEKEAEIQKLNEENKNYKKEIDAVTCEKNQISGALEELKRKYASLDELEDIYHAYNRLPHELKDSMSGFIRGDSLISFVISGARDSRIEKFWEFCRFEVQRSNGLEYSGELRSVFSYFFTKINAASEPCLYELITPAKGAKFDGDSMIPSNNSPSKDGVVDGLALPGYKGINTGKVIKKAIVTLKG